MLAVPYSRWLQRPGTVQPVLWCRSKHVHGVCPKLLHTLVQAKNLFCNARVEPIIYRRVILYNANTVKLLHRTIFDPTSSKNVEYIASHVKILVLDFLITRAKETPTLLNCCRGVETLAFQDDIDTNGQGSELLRWAYAMHIKVSPLTTCIDLAPKRLSIHLKHIPKDHFFAHPIFQQVTHLEIARVYQGGWLFDTLSHLKQLTHISLHCDVDLSEQGQLAKFVKQTGPSCCRGLRIIVIWTHKSFSEWRDSQHGLSDIKAIQSGDVDSRAVVAYKGPAKEGEKFVEFGMIARDHNKTLYEWSGQSTGKDFWMEAEEQIEERRR
jgi:hypothetical protein